MCNFLKKNKRTLNLEKFQLKKLSDIVVLCIKIPKSMTGIFRMPFDRTFATGRICTDISILFNKRLPKWQSATSH